MSQNVSTRVIESESYGSIEIAESQIFHFPKGIIGFAHCPEYALVPLEDTPFFILHAVNDQLSFILLPAHLAVSDYGFKIDDSTIQLLGVTQPEEVATYLIVNIVDEHIYVNLKAPILLSVNSRNGCQFVIDDPNLPLRHPLKYKEGE